MNKQLRRALSLWLALMLVLSMVGCGQKETVQTPDISQSETESSQQTPDTDTPDTDVSDDQDEPEQKPEQKPEQDQQPEEKPQQPEQQPQQPEQQPQQPEQQPQQPEQKPEPEPEPDPDPEPEKPSVQKGFQVHFIDVGQADAALVLCDGKAMLIDGGNAADSSLMYTYLKKHNVTHLDYVVGSHAHEDHIGGIAGALNYATVGTVYCPVTSYNSNAFNNFVKAVQKHGKSITVPAVGTSFSLGSATCTVLGVNEASGPNNSSIVLRIVYGSTSFLFTGDAEREVEQAILDRGTNISATVLKVGHHGSYTSTSYLWLRQIMPKYAVISVGAGNSYGHPTEAVLSRLRDAEVKTFRTDMQGDVICTSNGSSVSFTVSRNANADVFGGIGGNSTQKPEETPAEGIHYLLNSNSMKFHTETCEYGQMISDRNRIDHYGTREEVLEMGYAPCGACHP